MNQGFLAQSFAHLSLEQALPFDETKLINVPEYKRPCYGKNGQEISLIVNHFRVIFSRNLDNGLTVFHYRVEIDEVPKNNVPTRGGRGRGGRGGRPRPPPRPKPVEIREHANMAFWEAMRRLTNSQGHDQVIFDNFQNAWLPKNHGNLTCVVPHPDEKKDKRWSIEVRMLFNCEYKVNVNHSGADTKMMSELFMKCLVTQNARYEPAKNEQSCVEFVKKWQSEQGSIFKIHNISFLKSLEDEKRKIFAGVRSWIGLYAGAKAGEEDVFFNFGLANRLYYQPDMDLIQFYVEILEEQMLTYTEAKQFRDHLEKCKMEKPQRNRMEYLTNNIKVKSTEALIIDFGDPRKRTSGKVFLGERHYRIDGIDHHTAENYFPTCPKELRINHSMLEMYANLQRPLRYTHLPLVKVKQGNKVELQPMEVLFVHERPQKYAKILNMGDLRKYIQRVSKSPTEYKQETDELLAMANITGPGKPCLRHYGIQIDPNWTECSGRVLDAPILRDSEGKEAELTSDRTYKVLELTEPVKNVCIDVIITYFEGIPTITVEQAGLFYRYLCIAAKRRGIHLYEREPTWYYAQAYSSDKECRHPLHDRNNEADEFEVPKQPTIAVDAKKKFLASPDHKKKRHIIVVFTVTGANFYGRIKLLGNTIFGIPTQVVDKSTVEKAFNQTTNTDKEGIKEDMENLRLSAVFYNLALKINAKLGGVNMKADLPKELCPPPEEDNKIPHVMYVGIDVTHPGTQTQTNAAPIDISLASIVASTDYWGTQYVSDMYAQMVARETVECFDYQFKNLMWKFYEVNNSHPKHVVIYRDGVSDGAMISTAQQELSWIKSAWKNTLANEPDPSKRPQEPTYTYIVVQKRHHTRFLHKIIDKDGKEQVKNPPTGTVVDQKVVSPRMFDFFLASQHGAIGTSRMAHYTVVYDEWKLSPDDIYTMTYRLAFLNARCRKPSSLPAPVFYAHLACNHARETYREFVKSSPYNPLPEETEEQRVHANRVRLERKFVIERALKIHGDIPGMHFV